MMPHVSGHKREEILK